MLLSFYEAPSFCPLFRGQIAHRTSGHTYAWASDFFYIFLSFFGVINPSFIELKRAFRHTLIPIAASKNPTITSVQEFEELVLALVVFSRITDLLHGKLSVLKTIFFFPAFAQSMPIKTNNARMPKIGIHPIKAGRIRYRYITLISPRHSFHYRNLCSLAGYM